jgi:hypothetical protein
MDPIVCKSFKEWLEKSKDHTCNHKKITACDYSHHLVLGHECSCGQRFLLSGDDYINTLDELEEEKRLLAKVAMSSKEGRESIAESCNEKDFHILTQEEAWRAVGGILPSLAPLEAFDITQDDLTKVLYEACIQIERLPASEQQTRCISLVSYALRLYCVNKYNEGR